MRHDRRNRPGLVAAWIAAGWIVASRGQPAAQPDATWFENATASSGLEFIHVRADEQRFWLPEIMSGGAAWLDYDGDGDLDAYLAQGGEPDPARPPEGGNRLYRNDGEGGFVDVTDRASAGGRGYGMGAAVGDYDGDGDSDLYVTNVGPNLLLGNQGDGTFRDVSRQAGVDHPGWGTSAAFLDYDGDGDLDLFVVNYIQWSPDNEIECFSGGLGRDYCHPTNYNAPAPDVLYENLGDGTFEDASGRAGIDRFFGNGLGVTPADFNGDGDLDLYVANDGSPNQLWTQRGDGTFRNEAVMAGCAVNASGSAEAGMGVAAGDADGDGDLDLFVTHLAQETNTLYLNRGDFFFDATAASGLAAPSLGHTGFGTGFFDFDLDGWLDLYVVNGRVVASQRPLRAGDPFAEPDQLYRGTGASGFEELPGALPPLVENGRAGAFGDYDGDGDVDVLVAVNGGAAVLLRNRVATGDYWVAVRAIDAAGADAAGTRVTVDAHGSTHWARIEPAYSYCAANEATARVGLGGADPIREIRVERPDGRAQRYTAPPAARTLVSYPPSRRPQP